MKKRTCFICNDKGKFLVKGVWLCSMHKESCERGLSILWLRQRWRKRNEEYMEWYKE